jgi:site-specific recombinase
MLSYFKTWNMAIPLAPKQIVSFEELLMSQVVQQEALTRLLVERGIFTKEEFWRMVKERVL